MNEDVSLEKLFEKGTASESTTVSPGRGGACNSRTSIFVGGLALELKNTR